MVPTVFMQLDAMPQTPNGKTDLKQLPEPQLKLALVMPETETEEKSEPKDNVEDTDNEDVDANYKPKGNPKSEPKSEPKRGNMP